MHPRACVSAISTFRRSPTDDRAFWRAHGITNVGVSVAKLETFGWERGTELVVEAVGHGLQVVDLIGRGPFHLADPNRWDAQRGRLIRSIETAVAVGARRIVFTTGPFAPLTWEEAADALEDALAPVLIEARARDVDFAIETTNSLRCAVGFLHTLRDAV